MKGFQIRVSPVTSLETKYFTFSLRQQLFMVLTALVAANSTPDARFIHSHIFDFAGATASAPML